MAQIQFSIIITTYNRLTLLKRAIATALAQTMACEVIVVDDCSSDGTEAYVSSLIEQLHEQGNTHLVYYRNPSNLGHSNTMNVGVKLAKGEWIKPVDDDDYLAPNCIEEMSKAISVRPQAVICSCQAAQVDVNEVVLSITKRTGPGKVFYIPQEDIHYGMLLELVPFGTPIQVAFSRAAFLKSGGWDASLDTNFDDIDSWIKVSQFGDAVFINECLAYRTLWPGAYNQKFHLQTRLNIHVLMKRKIYDLVSEQHKIHIPAFANIQNYLKLHWTLAALKHGKILIACRIGFPAIFSLSAWTLILNKASLNYQSQAVNSYYLKHVANYFSYLRLKKKILKNRVDKIQIKSLRSYLKFRCSLAALQQGKVITAINLWFQALVLLATSKILYILSLPQSFNQQQIETDISFADEVYSLLNQNQGLFTASVHSFRANLKLRWSFLLFRKGEFLRATTIGIRSLLSMIIWGVLARLSLLNIKNNKKSPIRRIVLIDT